MADLLSRTVLTKVGHHGSYNATLREKGLELMTSPELVALMPVDREMTVKKKWATGGFPTGAHGRRRRPGQTGDELEMVVD